MTLRRWRKQSNRVKVGPTTNFFMHWKWQPLNVLPEILGAAISAETRLALKQEQTDESFLGMGQVKFFEHDPREYLATVHFEKTNSGGLSLYTNYP